MKKNLLLIFFSALIIFSAVNFFNPNKQTVSMMENRNLEKIIDFNFHNYVSGKFFSSIESWFSDTFVFREKFLSIASKIKNVLNVNNYIDSKDAVSIISVKTNEVKQLPISNPIPEEKKKNEKIIVDINDYKYEDDGNGNAEGLLNGYILYNDIAYVKASFVKNNAIKYIDVMDKYSKAFNNARTSIILAPVSSILLFGNDKLKLDLVDQNDAINELMPYAKENMYIINPCKELLDHRDEYIYFKYDHHWTQRGAYYAYKTFCDAIGEVASPIEAMDERILNKEWHGSAYKYTFDERLKDKTDVIYAYVSTRSNAMTINTHDGRILKEDNSIILSYRTYVAFAGGDNPLTIITSEGIPKDKNCLVIKDSFGCAFIPYLVNNYANIFVIDPRYTKFNFVEALKDFNIKDVISITSLQRASYLENIEMTNNMLENLGE